MKHKFKVCHFDWWYKRKHQSFYGNVCHCDEQKQRRNFNNSFSSPSHWSKKWFVDFITIVHHAGLTREVAFRTMVHHAGLIREITFRTMVHHTGLTLPKLYIWGFWKRIDLRSKSPCTNYILYSLHWHSLPKLLLCQLKNDLINYLTYFRPTTGKAMNMAIFHLYHSQTGKTISMAILHHISAIQQGRQ